MMLKGFNIGQGKFNKQMLTVEKICKTYLSSTFLQK